MRLLQLFRHIVTVLQLIGLVFCLLLRLFNLLLLDLLLQNVSNSNILFVPQPKVVTLVAKQPLSKDYGLAPDITAVTGRVNYKPGHGVDKILYHYLVWAFASK